MMHKIVWAFLAALSVAFVAIAAWSWQASGIRQGGWGEHRLEGLKIYGRVPDFTLIERSGRKISLANLKGKVWVAQFFYTYCTDICPLTVPQMGLLHLEYLNDPEFRSAVRFVSITVDPERDTPGVLSKYAERFSSDHDLWLFLGGDKPGIIRLAQHGFKLGVGEEPNPPEVAKKTGEEKELFHSNRLVLIDRNAQIRGYYSGIDAEAMVRLRRDLKTLLTEKLTS